MSHIERAAARQAAARQAATYAKKAHPTPRAQSTFAAWVPHCRELWPEEFEAFRKELLAKGEGPHGSTLKFANQCRTTHKEEWDKFQATRSEAVRATASSSAAAAVEEPEPEPLSVEEAILDIQRSVAEMLDIMRGATRRRGGKRKTKTSKVIRAGRRRSVS
jgi:hypothetical protein